jgi:PAS domain S-box-containing protein
MPGDKFIELAAAENRHVLDVLFRHASEAVTVQDQSGHLIYANQKAAYMIGADQPEDLLGDLAVEILRDLEIIDESGQPFDVRLLPGRRVLAGEEVAEQTVGYRRRGGHEVRWSRVHASPIKNDAGEVVWAINFFLDISDEVVRRQGERLMFSATQALGSSLDPRENLEALSKAILPDLGAWCAIHLVEEGTDALTLAAVWPTSGDARALFESDARRQIALDSDRPQARAVRSGAPVVINEITEEMVERTGLAEGPEVMKLVRAMEMRAVLCVPLGLAGGIAGTLTVGRTHPDDHFDQPEIDLIEAIGIRAGVAISNARRFQQDHETAEVLRRGLVPRFFPRVPGLEFAGRYQPLARAGHVGGDFYDVIRLSPVECAVLVGDIEGKGLPAAANVGLARHTLRATLLFDSSPGMVLGQLNEAQRQEWVPRMCTLAYLSLRTYRESTVMQVTLAGHPPPLVVRSDGRMEFVGTPCPPAGLVESLDPVVEETELSSGDTVIAYSDGFALRDTPPPETLLRLVAGADLSSLETLVDSLMRDLNERTDAVADDVALIAVRVLPPAGEAMTKTA